MGRRGKSMVVCEHNSTRLVEKRHIRLFTQFL